MFSEGTYKYHVHWRTVSSVASVAFYQTDMQLKYRRRTRKSTLHICEDTDASSYAKLNINIVGTDWNPCDGFTSKQYYDPQQIQGRPSWLWHVRKCKSMLWWIHWKKRKHKEHNQLSPHSSNKCAAEIQPVTAGKSLDHDDSNWNEGLQGIPLKNSWVSFSLTAGKANMGKVNTWLPANTLQNTPGQDQTCRSKTCCPCVNQC